MYRCWMQNEDILSLRVTYQNILRCIINFVNFELYHSDFRSNVYSRSSLLYHQKVVGYIYSTPATNIRTHPRPKFPIGCDDDDHGFQTYSEYIEYFKPCARAMSGNEPFWFFLQSDKNNNKIWCDEVSTWRSISITYKCRGYPRRRDWTFSSRW